MDHYYHTTTEINNTLWLLHPVDDVLAHVMDLFVIIYRQIAACNIYGDTLGIRPYVTNVSWRTRKTREQIGPLRLVRGRRRRRRRRPKFMKFYAFGFVGASKIVHNLFMFMVSTASVPSVIFRQIQHFQRRVMFSLPLPSADPLGAWGTHHLVRS